MIRIIQRCVKKPSRPAIKTKKGIIYEEPAGRIYYSFGLHWAVFRASFVSKAGVGGFNKARCNIISGSHHAFQVLQLRQ